MAPAPGNKKLSRSVNRKVPPASPYVTPPTTMSAAVTRLPTVRVNAPITATSWRACEGYQAGSKNKSRQVFLRAEAGRILPGVRRPPDEEERSARVYMPNLHNGRIAAAFTRVRVFVICRRPGNREGWLFIATGVTHAVMFFGRHGFYVGTYECDTLPALRYEPGDGGF